MQIKGGNVDERMMTRRVEDVVRGNNVGGYGWSGGGCTGGG